MYTKFFGLSRRPFEERADPQFYFPTPKCDEVLAALEYESQYGQSIALLIGEAGTGKTLLIRSLLMRGQPTDQSVVLSWTAEGQTSVIREACKAFGVTLPSSFSTGRGLARIRRHLNRVTANGRRALLVIDQAENLSSEHLAEISALSSLHLGDHSMLTIMLVGQPQIKALLDRTELSSLRQRLFGERVLAPFSRTETEAYIAHRVKVAGAANVDLFEPPAIDLIHRVSGGIPRLINRLAGEAMLSAYGASCKTITESVVSELVKENAYGDPMSATPTGMDAAAVTFAGEMAENVETASGVLSSASLSRDSLEVEGAPLIEEGALETDRADGMEYGAGSEAYLEPPDGAVFETIDPLDGGVPGGRILDQGHLMVEKLERTLARAQRMSTTSQAALAQSTAVETHLETLVGHAERIATELGGSVARAKDSLSSLNARIRKEISTTQSRMAVAEERLAAMPEVLEQADHRLTHLQHACGNAEQVESSLRKLGERLADQAETVQQRVGIAVAGTQAGQEALDRASQLLEAVQREEASHEQSSRRAADQVSDRLRTLDQSLAKADRIKEELVHKSLDQFEQTLQKALDRFTASQLETVNATQRTSDHALLKAERAIELLHGQTNKMVSEADRIKEDLLHKSIDHFEGALQEALDRFGAAQLEALSSMEARETELRSQMAAFEARTLGLQQTVRAADQEIDATLKKSTVVAAECKKTLCQVASKEQRVTQINRDLDNSIERGEAYKADIQRVTGNAEQLQRGVAAILVDVGAAHERAVVARDQLEGYKAIVCDIEQAVQRGQSATRDLDEIVSHTDQLKTDIAAVAEEASAKTDAYRSGVDEMEREAQATITRIAQVSAEQTEQLKRDVAVVAQEASAKTEAFRSGVDQVEREAQATITRIAQVAVEQKEQLKRDVAEVAQEASAKTEAFRSGVDQVEREAQATVARMARVADDRTHQVQCDLAAVVEQASAKTEAFRSGVDQVQLEADATITRIAQVATERTEQMQREISVVAEDLSGKTEAFRSGVDSVKDEADETIAQIARAVAQGSDAIGSISAEAQTKVTQLDSHNAAARVVLQQLADMNQRSHGLVGEAVAVLDELSDKTKHVASTIESLWGLASGAETQAKALADKQQEIESVVAGLAGEVQGAQAILNKLSEQSSGADAQGQIIANRCQDAKKIAERLTSISKLLRTAKESEQSITEMVDGARRVADELSSAAGASDQLLSQFSRQGDGILATISELETRAAKIESTIARATEQPAELVRSAKAQTAQLERVCGAVRKVFASLAKTTLEAKKQSATCGKINTSAMQQIQNLSAATDRSSKTLREWVAEAVRVQTRLERTLDQAPSIRETHPVEELAQIADRMTVGDAISEPLAGGELTMLGEPGGEGVSDWANGAALSESASPEVGERPENRADEISRLLADAKNLVP